MDKNRLKKYLESDEADKILKKNLEEGEKLGIHGVPTFIIKDRMVVGAQPHNVLKKAVLMAKKDVKDGYN